MQLALISNCFATIIPGQIRGINTCNIKIVCPASIIFAGLTSITLAGFS